MILKDGMIPISKFKTKAGEIARRIQHTGEPVLVTQHGRSAFVCIDVADYQALRELRKRAIVEALEEAREDLREGRTHSQTEVRRTIKAWARNAKSGTRRRRSGT